MRSWLWFSVLMLGCSAPLVDGRYACTDGRCPSGWYCHADQRCRTAPPGDAGAPMPDVPMSDVPTIDAPLTMGMLLDPCFSGTDCMSGFCQRGPTNNFGPGYCSQSCMGDVACPDLGESGFCGYNRVCELVCLGRADCPRDFSCVADFRDGTSTSGTCYPPTGTIEAGGDPCSTDDECGLDFICAGATALVCARPCGPAFACAASETCRPSARGQVCLP